MDFAYVGSYTTKKRGGLESGGISVFSRPSENDAWKEVQVYEMMNPSYLAFGRDKQYLYTVRADGDVVTAFSIDAETGRLSYLNEKHIGFDNGVFLTTDREYHFLFVASPGGIVSMRLNEDGSIGEICDIMVPKGDLGPLRPAQKRPCSHQICFDRDFEYLIEPNKGLDAVNIYAVDGTSGCLALKGTTPLPQSYCPRHIAFHPTRPLAYLLTEWIGHVFTCKYENGELVPIHRVETTPSSFVGLKNLGAEIMIHPSGKFVYASNRGQNSLVTFRILDDGTLTPAAWCCEGVAKPRFFTISEDGKWLYCANEESHSVTLYSIDQQAGTLTLLDTVMRASAPACILFKTT